MLKAIVFLEAMVDGEVPETIGEFTTNQYAHDIGRDELAQIARLEFSRSHLPLVIYELSKNLHPRGYYSHITSNNEMVVVFPGAHVSIKKYNDSHVQRAQMLGESYGVSRQNMSFRLMFEMDHPELHGTNDEWAER